MSSSSSSPKICYSVFLGKDLESQPEAGGEARIGKGKPSVTTGVTNYSVFAEKEKPSSDPKTTTKNSLTASNLDYAVLNPSKSASQVSTSSPLSYADLFNRKTGSTKSDTSSKSSKTTSSDFSCFDQKNSSVNADNEHSDLFKQFNGTGNNHFANTTARSSTESRRTKQYNKNSSSNFCPEGDSKMCEYNKFNAACNVSSVGEKKNIFTALNPGSSSIPCSHAAPLNLDLLLPPANHLANASFYDCDWTRKPIKEMTATELLILIDYLNTNTA